MSGLFHRMACAKQKGEWYEKPTYSSVSVFAVKFLIHCPQRFFFFFPVLSAECLIVFAHSVKSPFHEGRYKKKGGRVK